jgi:AdoMet-dependent rRNA methyltransferase SPB1
MLRKKNRTDFIDSCYNKNTYNYDPSVLPTWFLEEEKKYNQPIIPVTKEEVEAEKRYIKEYNARPSKKVAEFKMRKKRRMLKAMTRVREKATQIANAGELNAGSKMRQIKQLYSKEKTKLDKQNRKRTESVVGRNFSKSAPGKTGGRKYKMVDSRLKNDTRAEKRLDKKRNKRGKRVKIKK